MFFVADTNPEELGADIDSPEETADTLDDSLLDEISGDELSDEEGFGHLPETEDDDEEDAEEETEEDEEDDLLEEEEDAEDVDYDTFDDIDEM